MQRVDGSARNADHRVAPSSILLPLSVFLLPRNTLHVAQGYVYAANVAHKSVDYDELAVVAVVHLRRERREADGQEGHHLNAFFAHVFKETVGHVPAAHIVVDDTYLDTLTCFLDEGIADKAP